MSKYVDRFIKQHKEYFKRNESFIDNNSWNKSDYEEDIKELTEEIDTLNSDDSISKEDKKKRVAQIKKNIGDIGKNYQDNKNNLFRQENELTSSIVSRLSAFIKETEKNGERVKNNKVQKFIDFTNKIIQKHIKKCDDYLDYNMDVLQDNGDEDYQIDYKGQEIAFQDTIFKKKIGIQDNLDSLNISGDINNLKIEYLRNEKAAIPMMSVLPHLNADIKRLSKDLDIPTEIFDKEFYIHKNEEDIPEWDENKHYWEQEEETLKFWYNEWLKITKGFTVDGYFIHPWLYYHLNFFKTPMPSKKGGDEIANPTLRDNEWYIAELLKSVTLEDGYYTHSGVMLYGSRRIAKSTSMASICEWRALIIPNISTAITSGSEGDLTELTHKMAISMKYKEPAFSLIAQTSQWTGGQVKLGLKTKDQKIIEHSRHTIKNLAGGAKNSTQKTAGGAPSVYLIEEIGKFDWEKSYLAALPSFQSDYGLKTLIIAVGTGGEASLSEDAMKALANPPALKFLEMDWDMFESKIPKEAITWNRRKFANFVPGQMGMKSGFKRIERGFGDFLGIESEYLNKIKIFQTDWVNNTKVLLEDRDKVKNDNLKLQQEKVQYPIDPEECFLSAEENPFPLMEAQKHLERIKIEGDTGKKGYFLKNTDGIIDFDLSNKPLAEYPHGGGFIDAPGVLYEDIPETTPPPYLYVAGFDDYKQEESGTDSVGSFHIYKVNIGMDKWCGRPVYSLATRPNPWEKMYRQMLMAMEVFNAMCFMENADLGFKQYLQRKRIADRWLVPSMDFSSDMQIKYGGKRKYGWAPTQANKKFLFKMFVSYCKEEVDIELPDGTIQTMLGVERINDEGLLEEIIKYREGNNVDRMTSFMSCLGYEFYLHQNYMFPKSNKRQEERKESVKQKISRTFGNRMFGNSSKTGFFR